MTDGQRPTCEVGNLTFEVGPELRTQESGRFVQRLVRGRRLVRVPGFWSTAVAAANDLSSMAWISQIHTYYIGVLTAHNSQTHKVWLTLEYSITKNCGLVGVRSISYLSRYRS